MKHGTQPIIEPMIMIDGATQVIGSAEMGSLCHTNNAPSDVATETAATSSKRDMFI
jgi:hypothetical protein